eukprot:46009_1
MAQTYVNGNISSGIHKITSIFTTSTNKQFAIKLWTITNNVIENPDQIYSTIDHIDDGKSLLFCGNIIEIMAILMQYSQKERKEILRQSKCNTDLFFSKAENQMDVQNERSESNIKAQFEIVAYKTQYSSVRIPVDVSAEISTKIREPILHIYNHMIKSCTFHQNNEFMVSKVSKNGNIKIFNYGFHDYENADKELYCVAK